MLLSVLAVWSYGGLYLFYWSFYGKFGVSVLEIGLSQTEMIARALAGVALVGSTVLLGIFAFPYNVLFLGAVLAIQYISKRWPRWQWISRLRLPSVRLVFAVIFICLSFILLPSVSFWGGSEISSDLEPNEMLLILAFVYFIGAWPFSPGYV